MGEFISICLAIIFLPIFLLVFFSPSLIARRRNAEHSGWIFIANLVGGATGVGWIVVLIWALYAPQRDSASLRSMGAYR